MQFKTITISTFLGLAAATSSSDVSSLVNELPSCSLLCLMSAASEVGCGATDYTCQCDSEAAITSNATTCLTSACSVADIHTTKNVSAEICDTLTGSSTSTTSNKVSSNSTTTSSSSSSTASSTSSSTSGSSLGSRPELYSLGLAAIAGVTGLMVFM